MRFRQGLLFMNSIDNKEKTIIEENSIKKDKPAHIANFTGRWHNVAMILILSDLAAVNFSYITALWLRYDLKFSMIDPSFLKDWAHFTPIYTVFCLFVFWWTRLYKSIWKYAVNGKYFSLNSLFGCARKRHRARHSVLRLRRQFAGAVRLLL